MFNVNAIISNAAAEWNKNCSNKSDDSFRANCGVLASIISNKDISDEKVAEFIRETCKLDPYKESGVVRSREVLTAIQLRKVEYKSVGDFFKKVEEASKAQAELATNNQKLNPHAGLQKGTEDANPYGNKYRGLEEFLEELSGISGVEVPKFSGVAHAETQRFLKAKCPMVFQIWAGIGKEYAKLPDADKGHFLERPDVKGALESIQSFVEKAFIDAQDFQSPGIDLWQQGDARAIPFLMVRSSGIEDCTDVVNAGGNLSEKYVPNRREAILAACGRVVASYFDPISLKKQIDANHDPFANPLQLSVVVQHLIGASPEATSEPPPVSIVMFTTEKDYSEGAFRVTTLSATYGHGEGVVNNENVNTDTAYVVASRLNPQQLVSAYNAHAKPQRLAPVRQENGSVELKLADNPAELAGKRCLNDDQIQALYSLARQVEEKTGKPKDMELVVHNGTIYVVQMRDAERPAGQSSYLSDLAISNASINPYSKPLLQTTKTLVSAQAALQQFSSKDEVLICETLKEADESLFIQGQHKIVIVRQDEPLSSHPATNFRGKGIPCFQVQDLEAAKALVEGVGTKNSFIACAQSGRIGLWNNEFPLATYTSQGYFSHPASIGISLAEGLNPELAMIGKQKKAMPVEIAQAMSQLKLAKTNSAALTALSHLRSETAKTYDLAGRIARLPDITDNSPKGLRHTVQVMQRLQHCAEQAFDEIEAAYKGPGDVPRLEKLFHIKSLETLIAGGESGLNTLSFTQINALEKSVLQRIQYMADLSKSSNQPAKFVDLLYVGNMGLSAADSDRWIAFLKELESQNLGAQQQQFQQLITTLGQFDLLPAWLTLIALPLINGNEKPVAILKKLIKEQKALEKSFPAIKAAFVKLDTVERMRGDFATPATFEKGFEELKELAKIFIATGEGSVVNGYTSPSKLVALMTTQMLRRYTDVFDESIKSMVGSTHFNQNEKVVHLKDMVQENYNVGKSWLFMLEEHLSRQGKGEKLFVGFHTSQVGYDAENYFKYIDRIWDPLSAGIGSNLGAEEARKQLAPSKGFAVASAVFSSSANLDRQLDAHHTTLSDLFTLAHQNQLAMISWMTRHLVNVEELKAGSMPELLRLAFDSVEKLRESYTDEKHATLTGMDLKQGSATLQFTKPLANHSLDVQLDWNDSGELSMQTKFFGERGGRWKFAERLAQGFGNFLPFKSIVPAGDLGVQFGWGIRDGEALTKATGILQLMAFLIRPTQTGRFASASNLLDPIKGVIGDEMFSSLMQIIFKDPEILYVADRGGGDEQLHIYLSRRLQPDDKDGAPFRELFEGFMQKYGRSNDPAVISNELHHIQTLIYQLDAAYEDSYKGAIYVQHVKAQNCGLINVKYRKQIADLLQLYDAKQLATEDKLAIGKIKESLGKYSETSVNQLREYLAGETAKAEAQKAAEQKKAEHKKLEVKESAISLLLKAYNAVTSHSHSVQSVAVGDLAAECVSKSLLEDVRLLANGEIYQKYYSTQLLDRSGLTDLQIRELKEMARGLGKNIWAQEMAAGKKGPQALVYVDEPFDGYSKEQLQKVKTPGDKRGLEKSTRYPRGWYTQAQISNCTTAFVASDQPAAMQVNAENHSDYKGFISWNGGSNVHVGMGMAEPHIQMADPFSSSLVPVVMPNSEFCFAYQKRFFVYQQLLSLGYNEAAQKIKEASTPLIDEFMDLDPFHAQKIGRPGGRNSDGSIYDGRLDLRALGVSDSDTRAIMGKWDGPRADDSQSQKVMNEIVYLKCAQNPLWREKVKILGLADRRIAYLKNDPIWGTTDYSNQPGRNGLGIAVEYARDRLLKETLEQKALKGQAAEAPISVAGMAPPQERLQQMKELFALYNNGYAPTANRANLEAYIQSQDFVNHASSAKVYFNGSQLAVEDAKAAIYRREPVNIEMEQLYDKGLLKGFAQQQLGIEYECSAYNDKVLKKANGESFSALPNTVAVYSETFLWSTPGDEGSKKKVACLSLPAPALDTDQQPHYAYYMSSGELNQQHYRQEMAFLASCVVKAAIDNQDSFEMRRVIIPRYGQSAFINALSPKDRQLAHQIYYETLSEALNKYAKELADVDVRIIEYVQQSGEGERVKREIEENFRKCGCEVGVIIADILEVAQDGDLIVNAWDPHSMPGNGNDGDRSLDGVMGMGTAIGLTQAPHLNAHLRTEGAFRAI